MRVLGIDPGTLNLGYGIVDEEGKNTFYFLADDILCCVAGKKHWKKLVYERHISKICTVSDEAIAILILKNYSKR